MMQIEFVPECATEESIDTTAFVFGYLHDAQQRPARRLTGFQSDAAIAGIPGASASSSNEAFIARFTGLPSRRQSWVPA
jgi:hypothetical protein